MPNAVPIAVIDDDPMFLRIVDAILVQHGYQARCLDHYPSESDRAVIQSSHAILLDWDLDGRDGLELLQQIRQSVPTVPIIMVTGRNNPGESALQAIRAGAFDYVPKPIEQTRLLTALTKAIQHRALLRAIEEAGSASNEKLGMEGMVGRSPQIRTVFDVIRRVAPTNVSVMIVGESGTGKELAARALHLRSHRGSGPFVAVNMAALPKELVESTLFGHEKGAFTGADRQRVGVCEEANRGTLFLDEICEMPLDLQPKLLRFLQERVFRRVGGSKDMTADVRVISATNRDPAGEVNHGRLRADLYYRLNVIPIELPALRHRENDVPLVAIHLLRAASTRHGKAFTSIDPAALDALSAYDWPGNVRQLQHLIERCVVLNDGACLSIDMIPEEVRKSQRCAVSVTANVHVEQAPVEALKQSVAVSSAPQWPLESDTISAEKIIPLEELERRAIVIALRAHAGSPGRAAKSLGISEATIFRKIKALGLPTGKASN